MTNFLIGLGVGTLCGGTIVGTLVSAVLRLEQVTGTDHDCPDTADSDLRTRQYQQEHDELATLGGDL